MCLHPQEKLTIDRQPVFDFLNEFSGAMSVLNEPFKRSKKTPRFSYR